MLSPKFLPRKHKTYLSNLAWPGNVRQLENTCRWITVMAAGREVHVQDLPPELMERKDAQAPAGDWKKRCAIGLTSVWRAASRIFCLRLSPPLSARSLKQRLNTRLGANATRLIY